MTTEQREKLESLLNYLDRRMDKIEDKMELAERDGDFERVERLDRTHDTLLARQNQVFEVLNILGYSARWGEDTDYKYIILDD